MSAKEEDKKDTNEANEKEKMEEGAENEEQEEEEPVDIELQKEIKGLKIDYSDFDGEPKAKKPNKKSKNIDEKKNKKKDQDFFDYANKNNIKINLEYEENKFQSKKQDDKNTEKKVYKNNDNNKKNYIKGGKNRQQNRPMNHPINKFDNSNFQFIPQGPLDDNQKKNIINNLFSEENLNRDIYFRRNLINGKIFIDNLVNHNKIKRHNIDGKELMELLKDSPDLEIVNEDNKNFIKIKNFDKLKLLTIEEIKNNKKNMYSHPNMKNFGPYGFQNNMPYFFPYPNYGYGDMYGYFPEKK